MHSFQQAIDHRQTGDNIEAIRLLEEILLLEPDSPRVRQGLVDSYFNVGAYVEAEQQVKSVLSEAGTPDNVVANAKKQRHQVVGSIQFSYCHDSNANIGPTNADMNDDIQLAPSSLKMEVNYSSSSANFSHRCWIKNADNKDESRALLFWSSNVAVLVRQYRDIDASNLVFTNIQTGPVLLNPGKWKWNGFVKTQHIRLDEHKYGVNNGVSTAWAQYFTGSSFTLAAEYRDQRLYRPSSSGGEGDCLNIGGFYGLKLLDDVTLKVGVEKTSFDAKVENRSYDALRYSMRTTWAFAQRWRLSWLFSKKDYQYGGVEQPLYTDARKDDLLNQSVTMHYTVNDGWRLGLKLKLSGTKNRSNHDIHGDERDRAEIQLRRQF